MKLYESKVEGFKGQCAATWLNCSTLDLRITGRLTGFFKMVKRYPIIGTVKTGKEFHGHIVDGEVFTTENLK